MKTSVIEVHDMLSVFSVEEVEKRIGDVPGVESVTVNHAAGGATVRYDETRLKIADIKSTVRQRGYDPAAPAAAVGNEHEGHKAPGAPPTTSAPSVPKGPAPSPASSTLAPVGPKTAAPATKQDKAVPSTAEMGSSKSK